MQKGADRRAISKTAAIVAHSMQFDAAASVLNALATTSAIVRRGGAHTHAQAFGKQERFR